MPETVNQKTNELSASLHKVLYTRINRLLTNERTLGIIDDVILHVAETVLKGYADHSIFVSVEWDNPEFTKYKTAMIAEDVAKLIQGQLRYILHDTHISKGRKMLMIEQFCNAELAEIQTKQNYEDVLNYFTGMMRFLNREDTLTEADLECMALYLPKKKKL